MRMTLRLRSLAGLFVALALLAAACGGDDAAGSEGETEAGAAEEPAETEAMDDEADAGGELTGDVFVSGSSTVEPISARNAEKFAAENPNVAISVDGPGTGDGFQIFCNGESDVSDASRAIQQEEIDLCEQNGVEFIEIQVAIDGNSVITSTENQDLACLSFLDLYALVGPESSGFDTWSAANDLAAELESELGDEFGASHAPYPDEPLPITAPGEESGTFDSFVEIALEDIADARGQDATTRPDYQASPNDNVIVDGIGGSPSSLGWVGYAFVQANPEAIHAIEVDGGDGCVAPTPETIADASFPISRPLFIYVSVPQLEAKPELEAYIDYYMSDDGFASVSEVGYVDMEDAEIEANKQVWESRETGTRQGG
jgi:phosphate transport system substrate-binding protein